MASGPWTTAREVAVHVVCRLRFLYGSACYLRLCEIKVRDKVADCERGVGKSSSLFSLGEMLIEECYGFGLRLVWTLIC